MDAYIEVRNVSKRYKDYTVLEDVSYSFERGGRYAITGENGSGKSVFLKLLTGYAKPTSGEVAVNGHILRKDIDFIQNAGIIINAPEFIPSLSGMDNLLYLAEIRNKIGRKEILQTLDKLELTEARDKKVKTYSQGMKQRLRLAQALMEDPETLILDEPLNAIDRRGLDAIRQLLNEYNRKGTTLIFTSHYSADIEKMADVILEIADGRLQPESGREPTVALS